MRIPTAALFLLFAPSSAHGRLPPQGRHLRGDGAARSLQDLVYSHVQDDEKCPYDDRTRLFRTPGVASPDDCAALCYDALDCHYFSLGVSAFKGVCIGCTSDAVLAPGPGLVSYVLTEKRDDFPTASPVAASTCLEDADAFTTLGCDYASVLYGLNKFLVANHPGGGCGGHDAAAVLESLFPASPERAVADLCVAAWGDVPASTFQDVDARFSEDFMEEYLDGGTFLNNETGTFQGTVEGENIAKFRDAQATNSVVQGIPSLATCDNNAIMCCFGRDRQPNDNNGNCKDPVETKCRHADPADNSNLCWTDTDIPTFDAPFTFAGKSEGPIHCHGLAWDDDENSFEARLRHNNFFFISLYDHMYTRGYVETTVDSDNIGMCDCVENMPKVSRADCTEIDARQTFRFTYRTEGGFGVFREGDLRVNFNACKGTNPGNGKPKNNDLGSYVYRLNQDDRISDEKMRGVFNTLVGYENPNDNQNEAACEAAYLDAFGEAYDDENAGLKCPLDDGERLFRTENNAPLSLEECQALCYDTQFCQYFSLGISERGDTFGVCIGCTENAVLQADAGFNSYRMTSTQVFPTMAPTAESEYFDAVGTNVKCPTNQDRLFRTPNDSPLTRKECYDKCFDTEGCEYFTLGEDPSNESHEGLCIGCTAAAVLEEHAGFNSYRMEIKQSFPAAAPVGAVYASARADAKCPGDRLFRTPNGNPLTRDECYEKCKDTPGCKYFTLGEEVQEEWRGVCMGCGDVELAPHDGFNSYAILPANLFS